jgi:hypothetical protein
MFTDLPPTEYSKDVWGSSVLAHCYIFFVFRDISQSNFPRLEAGRHCNIINVIKHPCA